MKQSFTDFRKEMKNMLDEAVAKIVGALSKTLEDYAKKDDLKGLATKDDLKNLATELGDVKQELKADIRDIKSGINDLKADAPTSQEFNDRVCHSFYIPIKSGLD